MINDFLEKLTISFIIGMVAGICCASFLLEAKTLKCPDTKFTNYSEKSWTEEDYKTFESTKNGCLKYYKYKCVIEFIKLTSTNYHVICGIPRPINKVIEPQD